MRRVGSLIFLVGVTACASTVPATVTRRPTTYISGEAGVLLNANRQAARVRQSLVDAGVEVATGSDSRYALHVRVGKSRGSSPCGTTNNVSYDLRSITGRVMVIKARGKTGTCTPNVFDDMSRKLASYFAAPL